MKTSVPQVRPIEDVIYRIGLLIENAGQIKKHAPELFAESIAIARRIYEEEMKPRANLGKMDRDRVNMIGRLLGKIEEKLRRDDVVG